MNGEALPNIHGGPVRLLYPGWAGSLSHKWVNKITLRAKEHDGVSVRVEGIEDANGASGALDT